MWICRHKIEKRNTTFKDRVFEYLFNIGIISCNSKGSFTLHAVLCVVLRSRAMPCDDATAVQCNAYVNASTCGAERCHTAPHLVWKNLKCRVPGPLVPPDKSLPRRNITARSYSWTTCTEHRTNSLRCNFRQIILWGRENATTEQTSQLNKKAVLSQTWPRDAPTKVNKQPQCHTST